MAENTPSFESRQRVSTMLSDLWRRNRPLVEERVALIEQGGTESPSEEMRLTAKDAAHKLAGTLGMFGFEEGTEVARELEVLFDSAAPDSARVAELAGRLRHLLFTKP